jgi:hypothetical protein
MATRQGLFLDTETTGLDSARDEIIELAMVPFTYGLDGEVYAVGEPFQQLREPSKPIPPEITAITGIDNAMVAGQSIDPNAVAHFAAPASLVVAHNAAFDRKFLERFSETFNTKPWACSMSEIDWVGAGVSLTLRTPPKELDAQRGGSAGVDAPVFPKWFICETVEDVGIGEGAKASRRRRLVRWNDLDSKGRRRGSSSTMGGRVMSRLFASSAPATTAIWTTSTGATRCTVPTPAPRRCTSRKRARARTLPIPVSCAAAPGGFLCRISSSPAGSGSAKASAPGWWTGTRMAAT